MEKTYGRGFSAGRKFEKGPVMKTIPAANESATPPIA